MRDMSLQLAIYTLFRESQYFFSIKILMERVIRDVLSDKLLFVVNVA